MVHWLRICLPGRGHRFDPWSVKIPHALGQLSLCAQLLKPGALRTRPLQQEILVCEKPVCCN